MSELHPSDLTALCQFCGACCATSREWPRFSLETEAELDLIPEVLINDEFSGMRCEGDRCLALSGKVGERTACSIYAFRPLVCRACQPGDEECQLARAKHGLAPLPFDK
jgi:hypothetical protein